MKKDYSNSAWSKQAAVLAGAFCVAVVSAHAQTAPYYATTFTGPDVVNGASSGTTYTSNSANVTQPLAGQNGWLSNDATTPTAVAGTNQDNGGTTYVGPVPGFSGNAGAVGGIYRSTSAANGPDVVPSSAATNGVVNLYQGFTQTAPTKALIFTTDVELTNPGSLSGGTAAPYTNADTFALTLRSAATAGSLGAPLLSIIFSPAASPVTNPQTDLISFSINGAAPVSTSDGVSTNSVFHLQLTLTPGASPSFTAVISDSNGPRGFNAALTGVNPSTINQLSADYTVANKTVTNGGYANAGDNTLIFDNVTVVPEPSTYAMLALGFGGLIGMLRLRRKQA